MSSYLGLQVDKINYNININSNIVEKLIKHILEVMCADNILTWTLDLNRELQEAKYASAREKRTTQKPVRKCWKN